MPHWTPEKLRAAQDLLPQYPATSWDTALETLGRQFGWKVTDDSIRNAFKRAGLPSARSLLAGAHPVEVANQKAKARVDKSRLDSLVSELREAQARQTFLDAVTSPSPVIVRRELSTHVREATPIILASDWHIGETVTSESVAGRNKYNLAIAKKRVHKFFDAIRWFVEHHRASGKFSIKDMLIWLGGDLMTGFLHPDQMESNSIHPVEEVLWLYKELTDGLHTIVDALDLASLTVVTSHGNHGRTTQKMQVNTSAKNSFEWLLYALMKQGEKDERIKWEVTQSDHQYAQVYDFTLHFHHGHEVRYGGGVGGVGIPLLKIVDRWNQARHAHYHHIGHHHQLRDFHTAVVNGSLIGVTPYSFKFGFEPPAQAFYLLDAKYGKGFFTPMRVTHEKA